MAYCSKCGTKVSSQADFCSSCGADLSKLQPDKTFEKRRIALPSINLPSVDISGIKWKSISIGVAAVVLTGVVGMVGHNWWTASTPMETYFDEGPIVEASETPKKLRLVVPAKYDFAYPYTNGKALVGTGNSRSPNFEILDTLGNATDFPYRIPENGMDKTATDRNQTFFFDDETLQSFLWVSFFTEDLIRVTNDNEIYIGYADASGKLTIDYLFDDAGFFSEKLAPVRTPDRRNDNFELVETGKWGFIDRTGAFVIPAQFDGASEFLNGYAAIELDGKLGLVDRGGNLVVKPRFDRIGTFYDGLAAVGSGEKYGYINLEDKIIIPLELEGAGHFNSGRARVKQNGEYKIVDTNGSVVEFSGFDFVQPFRDGFALACKEIKLGKPFHCGIVDPKGTVVTKPSSYLRKEFSEGLSPVNIDGNLGYVDKTGEVVIEPIFEPLKAGNSYLERVMGQFKNGMAIVKKDGKLVVINRDGEIIRSPDFEEALPFSEGLAVVKIDGKLGFIGE